MNQTATAVPGEELGATAASESSVSAAGEQQSAETSPASPESSDYADALALLEQLERGEELQTIEPAPAAITEEATAAEAAADEAAATGEGKKKQRISVRGMNERAQHEFAAAADLVRSGQATSLADAIQQLSATQQATSATETSTTQPATAGPESVDAIATKIAELRAQRKQAPADFDNDKADELTVQIEDLQIDRLRAEHAATARTAQVQTYQQEYDRAIDELEVSHPEAADETSPFYQALSDRLEAAKYRKDPALADPRFILKMAGDVAKLLGTATKTAPATKPASEGTPRAPQATLQPPPARTSRPVGSSLAGGQVAASRLTPEQVTAMIEAMPYEEKMALLKEL